MSSGGTGVGKYRRIPRFDLASSCIETQCWPNAKAMVGTRWNAFLCNACPATATRAHALDQFFAKLKALTRKAAVRTKEALWQTAGQLLDLVAPAECQSYLANAGYEPI